MDNNKILYCEYCRCNTNFCLESDLLWHCDECGNVYGSTPIEDTDDLDNDDMGDIIKCPYCNNLVDVDELLDGYLCPVCLDDLSRFLD
jgi:hypothetical protein